MDNRLKIRLKTKRNLLAVALAGVLATGCATHTGAQNVQSTPELAQPVPQYNYPSLVSNYLNALVAERHGDLTNAANFYMNVLAEDPHNEIMLERAFTLFLSNGQVQTSIDLGERLAQFENPNPLVMILLTAHKAMNGDINTAQKYIDIASEASPRLLQFQLIRSYLDLKKGKSVEKVVEELEEFDTHIALEAHRLYHIGRILEYGGNVDEAIKYYEMANRVDPGSIFTVSRLGKLYEKRDNLDKAHEIYDMFVDFNPNTVLLEQAKKRIKAGKKPELSPIDLQHSLGEVIFGFSTLMVSQQVPMAARQLMHVSLMLNPDFELAQFYLGVLDEQSGDYGSAIKRYQSVSADNQTYLAAKIRLSEIRFAEGDEQQAQVILEDILQNYPDLTLVHQTLAEMYFRNEQFTKAVSHYNKIIDAIGEDQQLQHANLYFARGASYERMQNLEQAAQDLKRSLELNPNNATVLNYLGYMWVDNGQNLEEALAYITKALMMRPNDGAIIDSLGWAYFKMGDYEKAVKYLERAAEMLPNDPVINMHLGDAYEKVGRAKQARVQWQRALDLGPTSQADAQALQEKLSRFATASDSDQGR